jgi:hypothetical protein
MEGERPVRNASELDSAGKVTSLLPKGEVQTGVSRLSATLRGSV